MLIIAVILLIVSFISLVVVCIILKTISKFSPQVDPLINKITQSIESAIKAENSITRAESAVNSKQLREEVTNLLSTLADSTSKRISELADSHKKHLDSFSAQMLQLIKINEEKFDRLRSSVSEGLTTHSNSVLTRIAEMVTFQQKQFDSFSKTTADMLTTQRGQFDTFGKQMDALILKVEQKMEGVRTTVEQKLQTIQNDNAQKLEQIRKTVDEKLHETLEKRLGESFKVVSDQLDRVGQGLGEMKVLASGVGDLKKVLTNIKTRGTWGEIQLGNLLDQILTREQYAENVVTKKGSRENVEFALKLPGKEDGVVWLPIDAKFPKEDYERLVEAQDLADPHLVDEARKSLEAQIKASAKDIRDKYLDPPHTTDFGVLYLPTEGLYAEILRIPELWEFIQKEYRVMVAGPTTIAALMNSLQMGFRTLAIEKRAGEVWNLLSAVKTEFGKFGDLLDKTHKQLQTASDTIEGAARKSRTIERKLKNVQGLPANQSAHLLEELNDGVELTETDLVKDALSKP